MNNLQGTPVYFKSSKYYYTQAPVIKVLGTMQLDTNFKGQPKKLLAKVAEQLEQKGDIVIDRDAMAVEKYHGMSSMTSMAKNVEKQQIKLTLKTEANQAGVIRFGLSDRNLGIFGDLPVSENVTVGGTKGADTLKVIGRLSEYGFVKTLNWHMQAESGEMFDLVPRFRTYSFVGTMSEQLVNYPTATSKDENTEIREMNEAYFNGQGVDPCFNGKNHFLIDVPAGESVTITIQAEFWKKD